MKKRLFTLWVLSICLIPIQTVTAKAGSCDSAYKNLLSVRLKGLPEQNAQAAFDSCIRSGGTLGSESSGSSGSSGSNGSNGSSGSSGSNGSSGQIIPSCVLAPSKPFVEVSTNESGLLLSIKPSPSGGNTDKFAVTVAKYSNSSQIWENWSPWQDIPFGGGVAVFQINYSIEFSRVAFAILAVNSCGTSPNFRESDDSKGIVLTNSRIEKAASDAKAAAELKAKQDADAKAAAEKIVLDAKNEAARILIEAKAQAAIASAKQSTITCIKGKIIKKFTGPNPKCPAGYKRK